MNISQLRHAALAGLLVVTLALPAWRQALDTMEKMDQADAAQVFKKPGYSPYAGRNFPTRPFFGDTHLHTSSSFDAVAFGSRLDPEDAYRFARGEEVVSSTGAPAKLSRPLDFLVVADHSESIGVLGDVLAGTPMLMTDPTSGAGTSCSSTAARLPMWCVPASVPRMASRGASRGSCAMACR
jgi:hypothetical protein